MLSRRFSEFLKVTLPSLFTYLTFIYVDGKQAVNSFLNDIGLMLIPFLISVLIGSVIWIYLRFQKLSEDVSTSNQKLSELNAVSFSIAKSAYLWAWVANHFDLKGNLRTPHGTNPIVYKCFDNHHGTKEVIMTNEHFEAAMKWFSDRFDKNNGNLTPEDRMIFESTILQNIVNK
jgi:hypothetical protein